MTITGMNNNKPEHGKRLNGPSVTAALACGASRILPHVKLPVWIEMELAQSAMDEASRQRRSITN